MEKIIIIAIAILILLVLYLIAVNKNNTKSDLDLIQRLGTFENAILQKNSDSQLKSESLLNEKFNNLNRIVNEQIFKLNEDVNRKIGDNIKFTNQRLGEFENSILKINNDTQLNNEKLINTNFNSVHKTINDQIYKMNEVVNNKISENFKSTNSTFTSIVERLSKIDEAQKNIENLSTNIVDLKSILSDKTVRGSFGEVQLKNILVSIFGENNKVYKLQHIFAENNTRVDAAIFAPEPVNTIGIDSKFPLENYRKFLEDGEKDMHMRDFKRDLKKHIDDISNKYIIPTVTSQAIMFVPAEAVFAFIQSYCLDVVEYANKKNVWLTSPTTMYATLSTLQVVMQNVERNKHAQVIQDELTKLSDEFVRYEQRFNKLNKDIDSVSKDIKDISVTSTKITRRFDNIKNVELDSLE